MRAAVQAQTRQAPHQRPAQRPLFHSGPRGTHTRRTIMASDLLNVLDSATPNAAAIPQPSPLATPARRDHARKVRGRSTIEDTMTAKQYVAALERFGLTPYAWSVNTETRAVTGRQRDSRAA
jgi:hypothetical protein